MVALPWSCLPIVTKKKSYNKEIFFLSTPPNAVTLNWAGMLDKKIKEQGLALYTHKQYPCAIIEHITNVYLK
jgi:hypothetical protein